MRPGDVIADRFEILELVGAGGMGVVFRGRDRHTAQNVAIKVLRERDQISAARFFLEARVLAEIRHPGIVRYISHGTTLRGEQYLAMEWLTGESLADRLRQGAMSLRDALTVAARAADALGAAHAAGVVHRDVKPSNLWLPGGVVERLKVLDFGVARRGPYASENTPHGGRVGTPRYMSPEQVRGENVDARADVFALGCVVYAALTGRNAFVGNDEMAVLAKILLEDPPPMPRLRPDVPGPLAALVARMLGKDASARPADGNAVASELAALSDVTRASVDGELGPPEPERRLLTVVLTARQRARAGTDDLTAARVVAARHGAALVPMHGGFVSVVSGQRSATDQAAHAARVALALRPLVPDGPIAVATGLGATPALLPVGDVIDRAARLLAGAAGRAIVLDAASSGLLDERFEVHGRILIGERDEPGDVRTVLGKPTPYVGRERELAMLETVFAECVGNGTAHAVLVTAPPGVGKSRLCQEFLKRRDGVTLLHARGDPMRAGSPFSLIAPAVRRAAGVRPGDPAQIQRRALAARVGERVAAADVDRVSRFLGELVGLPFPDEDVQVRAARQDAVLMGDQMRRAWEDFLLAETEDCPVLLVLEDLHWGDLPSVHLVDAALRNLAQRPLMVLALARPEVRNLFPAMWEERSVTELRLGELGRKAAERLVRAVLPDVPPPTLARVVDLAQGNAFYLEELCRAVAEGKNEGLPDTVLAMVQARLEAFSPEARRILRAAAIFGGTFWAGGVAAILGDAGDLAEWLPVLTEREMIAARRDSRLPGETELTFRHPLVREAAYAAWGDAERERAHRAAGDWLEARGEVDPLLLAEHFRRGGEPRRAVVWYRRAAEQDLEGNDFEGAIDRVERALACGADDPMRVELLLLAIEAHRWRGGENEIRAQRCREVMSLSVPGDRAWCAAVGELVTSAVKLGDRDTCGRLAAELAALPPQPSAPLWIASARAVSVLLLVGMVADADRLLARLDAPAETRPLLGPVALAGVDGARAVRALVDGDLAAFLRLYQSSVEALELAGNQRRAIEARSNLGFGLVEVGAYAEAEVLLRANVAASERLGQESSRSQALQNLGWALARQAKLDEARAVEALAASLFERQGARYQEGGARLYLARILDLSGDAAGAVDEARRALVLLSSAPPLRCFGLAVLASALLARGDAASALAAAEEAIGILGARGEISEGEAFVRLTWAQALAAAGRVDDAEAARAAARTRLTQRANRMSDASLRGRFLTLVPENAATMAG